MFETSLQLHSTSFAGTSPPVSPHAAFTRTQRRRVSFPSASAAGSTIGAASASQSLRPEMFERLWSAHAVPLSWARSFIPAVRTTLTDSERRALRVAFREATGPAPALPSPKPAGDFQASFEPDAEANTLSAEALAALAATRRGAGISDGRPIGIDRNGAFRVRHIIATALQLTWLADIEEALVVMRAAANARLGLVGPAAHASGHASQQQAALQMPSPRADVDAPAPSASHRRGASHFQQSKVGTPSRSRDEPFESVADASGAALFESESTDAKHRHGGELPSPPASTRAVELCEDDVARIAAMVKAEAVSRRPVMLSTALGQTAKCNDDPFATADEVAVAFAALGGSEDLSSRPALLDEAAEALAAIGLSSEAIDEHAAGRSGDSVSDEASTTQRSSRGRRRRGSTGSDTASHGATQRTADLTGTVIDHAVTTSGGGGFRLEELLADADAAGQDQGPPTIEFTDFEAAIPVDPWKATCGRLFLTIGGDPSDPRSRAPIASALSAMRRMLEHELPEAQVEAFLERFTALHEGRDGISFEDFEATVVAPLRRVCAGEFTGDVAAKPGAGAGAGAGGGSKAAGSAGLMHLLTLTPRTQPQQLTTAQVLARLGGVLHEAKANRRRYLRLRARTGTVFKEGCVLSDTPLEHIRKLTRRRLLYVVNLVVQRRMLTLSPASRTLDAFLRVLTQAALVLKDHAANCRHCRRFAEAAAKPVRAETASGQGSPRQQRSPAVANVSPLPPAQSSSKTAAAAPLNRAPPAMAQAPPPPPGTLGTATTNDENKHHGADEPPQHYEVKAARLRREQRARERLAEERDVPRQWVPPPVGAGVKPPFCNGGRSVQAHGNELPLRIPRVPSAHVRRVAAGGPTCPEPPKSARRHVTSKIAEERFVRAVFRRQAAATADASRNKREAGFRL